MRFYSFLALLVFVTACATVVPPKNYSVKAQDVVSKDFDTTWQRISKFFGQNNIQYKEINSVPGNILTKLMTLTYLLDYSSIYRAVLSGIDPSPVSSINFIKSKI